MWVKKIRKTIADRYVLVRSTRRHVRRGGCESMKRCSPSVFSLMWKGRYITFQHSSRCTEVSWWAFVCTVSFERNENVTIVYCFRKIPPGILQHQGHGSTSTLRKQATYFMPLFLSTFFPSSVSVRIILTHSSMPWPPSPSPSSNTFSTLSKLGCFSK
jgi:hypothetical protein